MPTIALIMFFSMSLAAATQCILPLALLTGEAISDWRLLADTRIVLELVAKHVKEAPPKTKQKLQDLRYTLDLYQANKIITVQRPLLRALISLDTTDLRYTPESFQKAVRLLKNRFLSRICGSPTARVDFQVCDTA